MIRFATIFETNLMSRSHPFRFVLLHGKRTVKVPTPSTELRAGSVTQNVTNVVQPFRRDLFVVQTCGRTGLSDQTRVAERSGVLKLGTADPSTRKCFASENICFARDDRNTDDRNTA